MTDYFEEGEKLKKQVRNLENERKVLLREDLAFLLDPVDKQLDRLITDRETMIVNQEPETR